MGNFQDLAEKVLAKNAENDSVMSMAEKEEFIKDLKAFIKKHPNIFKNDPHPHPLARTYANMRAGDSKNCESIAIRAELAMAYIAGYRQKEKEAI